jgi:hypothetical protein
MQTEGYFIEIPYKDMFIYKCLICGYKTEPGWEGNSLDEIDLHIELCHREILNAK